MPDDDALLRDDLDGLAAPNCPICLRTMQPIGPASVLLWECIDCLMSGRVSQSTTYDYVYELRSPVPASASDQFRDAGRTVVPCLPFFP